MAKGKWKKEWDDIIIRERENGKTNEEIAKLLGVAISTVTRHLTMLPDTLGSFRKNTHIIPAEVEYIRTHYLTTPTSEMAKVLGRPAATICVVANSMGLKKTTETVRRAQYESICKDFTACVPIAEIARKHKVTTTSVYKIAQRYGCKRDETLAKERVERHNYIRSKFLEYLNV